jgi:hypothetical protein
MTTAFIRGLKRLFGIKSKRRRILAPHGSIMRPEIITEPIQEIEIQPVIQKKTVKKKVARKKITAKKKTTKKIVKKKKDC